MRRDLPWEKWAAMTICLAAAVFAVVFFARTLLLCLLPFLLAHLLSLAVIPLARKLSYKTKLPEKGAAVVLFFLLLAAVILPLGFGLARLLREAQDLLARLPALIADPDAFFQGLPDRLLPAKIRESEGYGAMREAIGGMIAGIAERILTDLGARLPQLASALISGFPAGLLFVLVTVIAGYFFCTDGARLGASLARLLPKWFRERLPGAQRALRGFARGYLRSYLLLLLITCGELLVGFLILGVDYALLLAVLIAIVDFFPLLGVGTVLLPWAAVELFSHHVFLGVGLLILCLITSVVRQVLEPRFVGQQLGLHPLLSLAAGYFGFLWFGFPGMLLGPLVALAGKGILSSAVANKSG